MYSLYTNPLRSLDCPAYEWIAKVSIIANHCQSFSIIAIFANHCLSFPLTFLGNNGCYEEAIIGSDNSFIMSTATTQLPNCMLILTARWTLFDFSLSPCPFVTIVSLFQKFQTSQPPFGCMASIGEYMCIPKVNTGPRVSWGCAPLDLLYHICWIALVGGCERLWEAFIAYLLNSSCGRLLLCFPPERSN